MNEARQAERRRMERLVLARVAIEIGDLCSEGRIQDVSSTGIRIEDSGLQPAVGAHSRVTFVFAAETFEMGASVVRHTDSGGFALEFDEPNGRLEEHIAAELREARASAARREERHD